MIWILEKTNDVWWRARNYYGVVGYAPVSYLQEESDPQPTSVVASVATVAPAPAARSESTMAPKTANKADLSTYPWYHPAISRDASETLLKGPLGKFLVRASSSHHTLSVNIGRVVEHFKISFDAKAQVFQFGERRFDSIPAIVEYYRTNAIFTLADRTPVMLTQHYSP